MIPFIFITTDEFKKFITLKYPRHRYPILFITWFSYYKLYSIVNTEEFVEYKSDFVESNDVLFNNYYLMLFCSSFVFIFYTIFQSIFSTLPKKDLSKVSNPSFVNRVAVIVPCHNSQDVIESTIEALLVHFPGEAIYIAENSNTMEPKSNETVNICRSRGVNYNYYSKPSKTHALLQTSKQLPVKYDYIFTIDDDTIVSKDFVFTDELFKEDSNVITVGYTIKMKDTNTIQEKCANVDYIYNSTNDYYRNTSTPMFVVGIAGMWLRDKFEEVYSKNPSLNTYPYGEDSWNGIITRMNGYRIKYDISNEVYSYAPDRFFFSINELLCSGESISGYGATNMWKQRALRWYRSIILRIPYEIFIFIVYNCSNKNDPIYKRVFSNIIYRMDYIYSLLLIYFSTTLPIFLLFNSEEVGLYAFIKIRVMLYFITIINIILKNAIIFRNRPDLRVSEWKVILFYPLFSFFNNLMRTAGIIGSLLFYIPMYFTPFATINIFSKIKTSRSRVNQHVDFFKNKHCVIEV